MKMSLTEALNLAIIVLGVLSKKGPKHIDLDEKKTQEAMEEASVIIRDWLYGSEPTNHDHLESK
jgi:hypothetical protein